MSARVPSRPVSFPYRSDANPPSHNLCGFYLLTPSPFSLYTRAARHRDFPSSDACFADADVVRRRRAFFAAVPSVRHRRGVARAGVLGWRAPATGPAALPLALCVRIRITSADLGRCHELLLCGLHAACGGVSGVAPFKLGGCYSTTSLFSPHAGYEGRALPGLPSPTPPQQTAQA